MVFISILPVVPAVALGGAIVFYTVILAIYRLFWHPLAGFPGPKLAALTKWYEFYFDIVKGHGGQFAWEIKRMHKVYGPIVRINPDEIHVEDPDWFETLYANNPTKRDKYPPAATIAGATLGTSGTVEHDIHRKRRAANSRLLSTRAIADAECLIQDQVQTLSDNLQGCLKRGEVVELRVKFLAFTTDTITRYALGESMGLQGNQSRADDWSATIRAVVRITPLVKQFPWIISLALKVPVNVLQLILPDLSRLLRFHGDMHFHAHRYVSQNQKDEKHADIETDAVNAALFQCICESPLPAHEKEVKRLAHEAVVVIAAGSETTSRVLTITMFYILSNKLVLKRLQDEIRTVMPDASKMPSTKTLQELPYLVAVIRESLRISALITSRMPLMAHNQLAYKEWKIPTMTPTSMTTHDILLDSNIFVDPHKFDPERWLVESPPPDRYFVAFGKGTRMCQGMKFAYSELYLTIATLIRRFNLQLYDTVRERDVDFARDCFIGEHHPDSLGVRVTIEGERP